MINIFKSETSIGFAVKLVFQIAQHSREEQLLRCLVDFLGCGTVYVFSTAAAEFRVTKFSDVTEKVIPFFSKYKIHGVKAKDFAD